MGDVEQLMRDIETAGLNAKVEAGKLLVGPRAKLTSSLSKRIGLQRAELIHALTTRKSVTDWAGMPRSDRWRRCNDLASGISSNGIVSYGESATELLSEFCDVFGSAIAGTLPFEAYKDEIDRARTVFQSSEKTLLPDRITMVLPSDIDTEALHDACMRHPGPCFCYFIIAADGFSVTIAANPFVRISVDRSAIDDLVALGASDISIDGGGLDTVAGLCG